jgi:hypothetical protein
VEHIYNIWNIKNRKARLLYIYYECWSANANELIKLLIVNGSLSVIKATYVWWALTISNLILHLSWAPFNSQGLKSVHPKSVLLLFYFSHKLKLGNNSDREIQKWFYFYTWNRYKYNDSKEKKNVIRYLNLQLFKCLNFKNNL